MESIFGTQLITPTQAAKFLAVSGLMLSKLEDHNMLHPLNINNKKAYELKEVEALKASLSFAEFVKPKIAKNNTLNDLTGAEWIPETKSYMYQRGLGANHPDAQIEKQHPAPYSFQDIEKLILFFTKQGMSVLDPFGGIGSTAKAAELTGRKCTSIELSPKYHDLSILRLEKEVGTGTSKHHNFINGDSCRILPILPNNSVDMVVTSPPYWGILHKQDRKVETERVVNNLDTKYSDSDLDLGNIKDYGQFLRVLTEKIFMQCARILRNGKYMLLIVSDFRDKGEYISFHTDLIQALNNQCIEGGGKLVLQGTKILIQNNKRLMPYGYPFAYVENIHHQYILIFRKK